MQVCRIQPEIETALQEVARGREREKKKKRMSCEPFSQAEEEERLRRLGTRDKDDRSSSRKETQNAAASCRGRRGSHQRRRAKTSESLCSTSAPPSSNIYGCFLLVKPWWDSFSLVTGFACIQDQATIPALLICSSVLIPPPAKR